MSEQKDYIKTRLEDQITWYDSKSKSAKCYSRLLKILILILSTTIPLISGFHKIEEADLRIVVGILGAWLFSKMSKKIGNIKALLIGVIIWSFVCFAAYLTANATQFYILGALVGLVLGGIQALSRSTYSKLLPETTSHATYFSFYDVGEKLATMFGAFCVGWMVDMTGDYINTALVMTSFFVIGFLFLITMPKNAIPDRKQLDQ